MLNDWSDREPPKRRPLWARGDLWFGAAIALSCSALLLTILGYLVE